ncbi:MAG: TIGR01244 family phosphatase [Hyphomicrobiales bacterium]|nr:MAG: TIGR01244 family phosphatase [Hyphomicrobiales bacterium]
MEIKTISETLSVSPQIRADEIQTLVDRGFRSIICNRPDGEDAGQQTFAQIEKAAIKAGLEARYIPIAGRVSNEVAAAFDAAMQELPTPTLAYCRSGARSAMLWSLSQSKKLTIIDILAATKRAGYDMAGVVRRLSMMARNHIRRP